MTNNVAPTFTNISVTIDASIAPMIKQWLDSGRGVKVWYNLEIASGYAREVYTPGDMDKPGWRYGKPTALSREQIQVSIFQPIESFRGRFKAMYFGPWVNPSTEAKAERLCAKHGLAKGSWQWQQDDLPGYVQITIGQTTTVTFAQWEGLL